MQRLRFLLVPFVLLALAACASTVSDATPQQRIYGVLKDYRAVLVLANAYHDLPTCQAGQNIVTAACKDRKVIGHIQKADNDTYALILAATSTIRTSCPDEMCPAAQTALVGAMNAVTAFRSIVVNRSSK